MNAYFCQQTGVRIVAPGVSKLVDPKHGQDLADPPEPPVSQEHAAVQEIEQARARQAATEKKFNEYVRRSAEEIEAIWRDHAAHIEKLRAEHQAEIEQIRAAHTAELDALTKPSDPEAGPQESPPTVDAAPRRGGRGGNK